MEAACAKVSLRGCNASWTTAAALLLLLVAVEVGQRARIAATCVPPQKHQ